MAATARNAKTQEQRVRTGAFRGEEGKKHSLPLSLAGANLREPIAKGLRHEVELHSNVSPRPGADKGARTAEHAQSEGDSRLQARRSLNL